MPGLSAVIGRTEAEAEAQYEYLQSLIHPVVAREILSLVLGNVDLSGYALDNPFPENLPLSNASLSTFQYVIEMARNEKLSLRQVAMRVAGARGKSVVRGSPAQIADHMERWFKEGGCDGFNLMPPFLPGGLDDFVELVLPQLRARGLFRTEYEGSTLRDHLGLARPASRHAAPPAAEQKRSPPVG
jgi:alkanesulfonate monooxygenase SsuD/methylene tetrahydromethanopterin reductase-like flavin-dependent oxidoreductase (luciferase family)